MCSFVVRVMLPCPQLRTTSQPNNQCQLLPLLKQADCQILPKLPSDFAVLFRTDRTPFLPATTAQVVGQFGQGTVLLALKFGRRDSLAEVAKWFVRKLKFVVVVGRKKWFKPIDPGILVIEADSEQWLRINRLSVTESIIVQIIHQSTAKFIQVESVATQSSPFRLVNLQYLRTTLQSTRAAAATTRIMRWSTELAVHLRTEWKAMRRITRTTVVVAVAPVVRTDLRQWTVVGPMRKRFAAVVRITRVVAVAIVEFDRIDLELNSLYFVAEVVEFARTNLHLTTISFQKASFYYFINIRDYSLN